MFRNNSFCRVRSVLLLALALMTMSTCAWAQLRVFARVVPNQADTTDPLYFDINNDSSDDVSPNIILAKDGQSAYVAYTGSGAIIRFSLTTGEILTRIKTNGTPCFATQLPNDRIAFVSVFKDKSKGLQDNRIFVVDMNTDTVAATFSFADAQFGFGSNIALSPDGTTGYISSTGTGEVIKFSTADGLQVGRFNGSLDAKQRMRFPTQITVTPDGATLIVVDTDPGTPEVAFFDSSTFIKKGSLKNPSPTTQLVAFTIFNRAVLAPDGKTGIIASRGANSIQYSETVFLFDATNGTILKTGSTGPAPQWTGITPDGKNWVIVNMFSITVIPTDDFDKLIEYQAPAGESLGSANVVFSPDSKYAYYAAAGPTGVLHDIILQVELDTGAFVEKLQVGDNPDAIVDEAASMAITPDGKTIVALEFYSNCIDLMTQVYLTAGGKFQCSVDTFTGLSLLNLSSQTNKITVYAMQDFGEPNQETDVTNPVVFILEPNQQISRTVSEIFNFDDSTAPNGERTGWLAIYSEQPEITGYVTIGKKDFTNLNGLPLDRAGDRLHDWILPIVERNGDATIQLSTLNDTHYTITYDMSRVGHDGKIIDSQPGRSTSADSRVQEDLPDIFPRDHLDTEGYLWLTSTEGAFSNEIFNNGASTEIVKGIDRYKHVGVTKLYAPQYATVSGWKTTLNLINASTEEADVTVTFHGGDATILWQFQKHFAIGEQIRDDVANLFSNPPSDFTNVVADPAFLNTSGWMEVESTKDQILGSLSYNATGDHVFAVYDVNSTDLKRFTTVRGWKTTLDLSNVGPQEDDMTVTFYGNDGTILWQFQKHFTVAEELLGDLADLYSNPPSGLTSVVADAAFLSASGWMEIASTQGQILGTLTITATDDHFSAGYELTGAPLSQFIFPIISQNEIDQTGVALLNPNSDPAHAVLELWGMDGNIIATAPLTLNPLSRTAAYLDTLFPGMNSLLMGNLRIRSDKALCGYGIVNDSGFNFVMAMPAISIF
jgi:hypothetical protein